MIKILVTDDEHHVVNYMVDLLSNNGDEDWALYKAYNGYEALEILKDVKIDIVLLDIEMPGISGLEVGKKINQIWSQTHIIYLTAYDNFEYIYSAQKLQIDSFLLKTEDDEVIIDNIRKTVEKIYQYNSTLNLVTQVEKQKILLNHMLQQEILKDVENGYDEEIIKEKINVLGDSFPINYNESVFCIMANVQKFLPESSRGISVENTMLILQFFQRLFEEHFKFIFRQHSRGNWAIFLQVKEDIFDYVKPSLYLKSKLQSIIDFYMESFHMPLHLLLYSDSFKFNNINYIVSSLSNFEENLQKNSESMEPLAIMVSEEEIKGKELKTQRMRFYEDEGQRLYFYIQKGDRNGFLEVLKEIKGKCVKNKSMHSLDCIQIYTAVSNILLAEINKYKLEAKLAMKVALYPLYYFNDFETWNQAFNYLEKIAIELFNYRTNRVVDKNQILINKIKDYIMNNYKEPINLTSIANSVNYNESYISRLFKQMNGIGLNEYLTQIRLEKAKKYLKETNDSMQAISQNTGFDTAQYFSSVFKKYYGISPTDYRNQE